jgi:antitoxin component YwqK of YwqJK toxin-antitoxin module
MKIKKLYIVLAYIFFGSIVLAQEIRYKEKANENYTRFFYDDNYYLVDKDCEFKAIERVAQYDTVNWEFNGEFKDFNSQGKLLLHGFYRDGIRNGKFTAYHPNGQIRWESEYVENKEKGLWKYYYPDGKPMLTLAFDNDDFQFVDFWDTFGIQKITNGEGEYEMTFPIKGFTDHGFTSYLKKGKISKGKPEGSWLTSFIIDDRKKKFVPIFNQSFIEGKQDSYAISPEFLDQFIAYEDFYIVPSDFFSRAESFIVYDCNFDSYSGFIMHNIKKFNHYLSDNKFDYAGPFEFKVIYEVSNKGLVNSMEILEIPEDFVKSDINKINALFESVEYFIPSIQNGKQIRDNIILTANFLATSKATTLQHLKVERENGK